MLKIAEKGFSRLKTEDIFSINDISPSQQNQSRENVAPICPLIPLPQENEKVKFFIVNIYFLFIIILFDFPTHSKNFQLKNSSHKI